MGRTRAYADRTDLAQMAPHGELSSTGHCLANPGKEHLVYAPKGETTVDLSNAVGVFAVEWMDAVAGTMSEAGPVGGGAKRAIKAPFAGDGVLYIFKK